MKPGSVKIGRLPDGKLTGEACVLFPSVEQARDAQRSLNKEYLGSRYVDLFVVSTDFHSGFLDQSFGQPSSKPKTYGSGSGAYGTKKPGYGGGRQHLSDFVTEENQYRSLKLRGLPFSAGQAAIRA